MEWTRLPPLSQLRAFEAAARRGGFSAAARELNVTHAAVGQQVRALEAHLGAQLFERRGRALALSEDGARLAADLGAGFSAVAAAVERFVSDRAAQPVRVSLTPSFAAGWLTPRLGVFRSAHPEIGLSLSPDSAVVDLASSDFDLAIRFGAGRWPGVVSEPLLSGAVVVVAAARLLGGRRVAAPEDLFDLPWIKELGSNEAPAWLASVGAPPSALRALMEMPGYMALEALRAGQGVWLTPRSLIAQDLADGRLVALFDVGGASGVGYHLVRRDAPLRPTAERFAAWLRRESGGGGRRQPDQGHGKES